MQPDGSHTHNFCFAQQILVEEEVILQLEISPMFSYSVFPSSVMTDHIDLSVVFICRVRICIRWSDVSLEQVNLLEIGLFPKYTKAVHQLLLSLLAH